MVTLLFGVTLKNLKKRLLCKWYVMYDRYINTEVPHREHLLAGVSLKGVGMTYRQKCLKVVPASFFCLAREEKRKE